MFGKADADVDKPSNNVVPITSSPNAVSGTRPKHPERRANASATQVVSDGFKALLENEKADFIRMNWHLLQPAMVKAKADPKNPQCFATASKRASTEPTATAVTKAPPKAPPKRRAA